MCLHDRGCRCVKDEGLLLKIKVDSEVQISQTLLIQKPTSSQRQDDRPSRCSISWYYP